MAGMFDDLVPQQATGASGGMFDDLVPAQPGIWDQIKSIPGGMVQGLANAASASGAAAQTEMGEPVTVPGPQQSAQLLEQNVTGALPNNGTYGRSIGEMLGNPATWMAPGGILAKGASAIGSGVGSQLGGEIGGTPGAIIGGMGGGMMSGLRAPLATAEKLTPQQVIDAGSAAYRSPEVMAVQIKPQAAQRISDNIGDALNRARLNDRLAPQTHAILDTLPDPVNGPAHTLEDFQTVRTLLGKQAGNFSNPTEQAAASKAIDLLDQHVSSMPQSDLLAGNIADANATLTQGRGDDAAGMAAQRVQGKLDNADLQAASAHSGGNIDNATRQKLRTLLTSPSGSRGLTPDELDQIDQVVRGSTTGNVLRAAGKVLGGGGGLGSMLSAAEGFHVAGPIGAAAPLAGYGIKKMGDALTTRAANNAVQQILSRAPSFAPVQGGANAAQGAALSAQQQAALRSLLLSSQQIPYFGR